jgi:hypothetical protein
MLQGNTEDPQLFVDYARPKYPGLDARIPVYGERMEVECNATG